VAEARPRLGVLGGSFDPPHLAHLVIASEACSRLNLERVLFAPASTPPHKDFAGRTASSTRLEMTELAVEGDSRFAVSGLEIERGLVYTRDALASIAACHPSHDLVFVMGSDSLLQFDTWEDPRGILELCTLAVALRPGDDREVVAAAAVTWGDERVSLLDPPLLGLSSSDVRSRVAAGLPIRYLVPDAVEAFIRKHRLYGGP
jgi:nicotinate-nucleotide adenylyltransferase